MSIETQAKNTIDNIVQQLADNAALADPATLNGLNELIDKLSPLVQAGRFNNIIDLLSLMSDSIEFLDEAMFEKMAEAGEGLLSLGWTAGNAIRMANAKTEKLEQAPTLIQLMRTLNDPDVRRSLHFFLECMRVIGKQMK